MILDRYWSKVDKDGGDGCWVWRGTILGTGYGQFSIFKQDRVLAHRFAYELGVGPIPAGLTIDHLCRNRACVNPAHLEPVTMRENTLRGLTLPAANARKTHCDRGHEFNQENTYVHGRRRHCRMCRSLEQQQRRAAA